MSYGDEKFPPDEYGPVIATPTTELLKTAKEIAQVQYLKNVFCTRFLVSYPIHVEVEKWPGYETKGLLA